MATDYNNNHDNRNRALAALLTLLITAGTVVLLITSIMSVDRASATTAQLAQDSIVFGGDYVLLGDMPEPTESDDLAMSEPEPEPEKEVTPEPKPEGDDLKDHGNNAPANKPLVAAKTESPMKLKKEEPKKKEELKKPTGTAKPAKNEKQEQTKRATGSAAKTDNKKNSEVKNAFARGGGKQGDPNGNNATGGSIAGKPGVSGLDGYTLENWPLPAKPYPHEGTINVSVIVNARGKVTGANTVSGSGAAYGDVSLRKRCEQAALKSSFSVKKSTTTDARGTITYRFK